VLYSINYKTTCFGRQWPSSGFHQSKNALRWCYIICVTECWWRDLIISIPFYGYCCNIRCSAPEDWHNDARNLL